MNAFDIRKLNNLMKYDYARDADGNVVLNGSLCISSKYRENMKYEDDYFIFDLSSYLTHKYTRDDDDVIFMKKDGSGNMDSKGFPIYSYPEIAIIEYFKIDEEHIYPFIHQYSGLNFKTWYDKDRLKKYVKIKCNDISKIKIRYPSDLMFTKDFSRHLQKIPSPLIQKHEDYIDIEAPLFKFWAFLDKMMKGVKRRECWTLKYDEFPSIFFNVNNNIENMFSYDYIIDRMGYLKSYYSNEAKNAFIYCQHPMKMHKEYFFSNFKDIESQRSNED